MAENISVLNLAVQHGLVTYEGEDDDLQQLASAVDFVADAASQNLLGTEDASIATAILANQDHLGPMASEYLHEVSHHQYHVVRGESISGYDPRTACMLTQILNVALMTRRQSGNWRATALAEAKAWADRDGETTAHLRAIAQALKTRPDSDDAEAIHDAGKVLEQAEAKAIKENVKELDTLGEKIRSAGMNELALKTAEEQLARLTRMHPDSSEASMVRGYLDLLIDLPWDALTINGNTIPESREILNNGHAYLDKIHERIIEEIGRSSVGIPTSKPICLVGPPGVGKTSVGRKVAEAMDRKFARVALGGVSDEAEIRGHRRTYMGALPGKIIRALRDTNTRNPVFMLDEVDKLGKDHRGDPTAALLEVLDPEQNNTFTDHFLDVPFDLSSVFFIITANDLSAIPVPLQDRMQVIQLPSYLPSEKLVIATKYQWPKLLKIYDGNVAPELTQEAAQLIIDKYTREAGVRDLERQLDAVLRKILTKKLEGEDTPDTITPQVVEQLLGPPEISEPDLTTEPTVGVVNGLAWTGVGGDLLPIEVDVADSDKPNIEATGKLGEVFQESIKAAARYVIRSDKKYKNKDIHVHTPEAAVPKDGPSAGMAIAVGLKSALDNLKVRHDVAMTGEITIRGRVLPIGGVREKAWAAVRDNMTTIILPKKNEKDWEKLPNEIKDQLEVKFVTTAKEAFEIALIPNESAPASPH